MSEVNCKSWSEFWNQLFYTGFKLVILIISSNGSCWVFFFYSGLKTDKIKTEWLSFIVETEVMVSSILGFITITLVIVFSNQSVHLNIFINFPANILTIGSSVQLGIASTKKAAKNIRYT